MNIWELVINKSFTLPPASPTPEWTEFLKQRRLKLLEEFTELKKTRPELDPRQLEEAYWLACTYPVLAVNAPALTTHEGKIEFPGDPMCLYHALCVTIDQVVKTREHLLAENAPYNDLCPQWGILPDKEYRAGVSDSGIRKYCHRVANTDETIFDPRVWNPQTKGYFVALLAVVDPIIVAISTTSPGHRYSLDIASTVKKHKPNALVIFGGRHIDETIKYNHTGGQLEYSYSSTLSAMKDNRAPRVVDFLISGDAYYALDLLIKAISLAMDIDSKTVSVSGVIDILNKLATFHGSIPGRGVIVACHKDRIYAYPFRGSKVDLGKLPPPYRAFAIRARFPIFQKPSGEVQRTAHMLTINACPFDCEFCSEACGVRPILKFRHKAIDNLLGQIIEYVNYGAESIFFDDSVLLAGDVARIRDFCQALYQAKKNILDYTTPVYAALSEPQARERFLNLKWGAQLTVDFLTTINEEKDARKLLEDMRRCGCTYIYLGIESMSNPVIRRIDKNKQKPRGPDWNTRVRAALRLIREVDIRCGAAVLFGLEGENRTTIEETIECVEQLINDGLVYIISPNILTYHPGTRITNLHGMIDKLDYASLDINNRPPYVFFEEAYPGVVSKLLNEDDIWYIHKETLERWKEFRNNNPMQPTSIPTLSFQGQITKLSQQKPVSARNLWRIRLVIEHQQYDVEATFDPNFDGAVIIPKDIVSISIPPHGYASWGRIDGSIVTCPVYTGLLYVPAIDEPIPCTVCIGGSAAVVGRGIFVQI